MISKAEGNQHYSHQLPPVENLLGTNHQQYWNNTQHCEYVRYIIFDATTHTHTAYENTHTAYAHTHAHTHTTHTHIHTHHTHTPHTHTHTHTQHIHNTHSYKSDEKMCCLAATVSIF